MRIPISISCCKCGRTQYVFINFDDSSFEWRCPCGEDLPGSLSNNITSGLKILYRSNYELMEKNDFSISIILSAMAVECELSRLYFKWKQIDSLKEINDNELEKDLRNLRIDTKFEEVCKLMSSKGLADFIRSKLELKEMIENGFPSLAIGQLSKDFQEKLFWPRNRILHLGESRYTREDATRCFNFASLGLRILEVLDTEKRYLFSHPKLLTRNTIPV